VLGALAAPPSGAAARGPRHPEAVFAAPAPGLVASAASEAARGRRAAAAVLAALALALAAPASGEAARGLDVGFYDGAFTAGPAARDVRLDEARAAGATVVRIDGGWPAARRPRRPADPADARYAFGAVDDAVRAATGRGLRVLLSVTGAPRWAEGPRRPRSAPPRSWRPSPTAVGAYGEALARRYSGAFPDPARPGSPLPNVSAFQLWNEPNLGKYLTPQWRRGGRRLVPAAPAHYRRMLNAFSAGVRRAQPRATVVTAGTAPFGDPPGGQRMPPARFVRELLRRPVRFDVLAHHPYSVAGPFRRALNRDDVSLPDLGKLVRPLHAAERAGRALPRARKRLWITEVSWDSRPPDPDGVPAAVHARWLAEALYVLWRQGAGTVLWFQVRDQPPRPSYPTTSQSGVLLRDGRPKLARRAFAFPFVARRPTGARRITVWARAPAAGMLTVERRTTGGWRALRSSAVTAGQVVLRRLAVPRGARLRARVGNAVSRAARA
jgi:hypothetical protein